MKTRERLAVSILLLGTALLASFIAITMWNFLSGGPLAFILITLSCTLLGVIMLLIGFNNLKLFNEFNESIFKISGFVLMGISLTFFILSFVSISVLIIFPNVAYIPLFLLVSLFLITTTFGTGLLGLSIKKLGNITDKRNVRALGDLFLIGSFLSVLYLFGVLILFISSFIGFQKLKKL